MRTVKPALRAVDTRVARTPTTKDTRPAGRPWQRKRFNAWRTAGAQCAGCGRVVAHPDGYELDHITPLEQGGSNADANLQVLCVWWDEAGNKRGCHAVKTAAEAAGVRAWKR